MKIKTLISSIIFTFFIVLVYTVSFAASQPASPPGKWWNNPEVAKQLNITESQKKAIQSLFNENKGQFKNLIQETRKIESDLKDAMGKNFDQSRALSLIDKLAENRSKMIKDRFAMEVKVLGILTPEQRELLSQKKNEMMEKRKSMMNDKGIGKGKGF